MAKGKKKSKKGKRRREAGADAPVSQAVEDEATDEYTEDADADVQMSEAQQDNEDRAGAAAGGRPRGGNVRRGSQPARVGGLSIYKPGQGYYTRMGTAIGAGVLIAVMWHFLFGELGIYVDPDKPWTTYLQMGVPTLVAFGLLLLVYWVVGRNRRTGDFMILTEGEMKKVSWSSKKEVIGSTKVVIFTVIAMAIMLFVVDLLFMTFFNKIGVLQAAPSLFKKATGAG